MKTLCLVGSKRKQGGAFRQRLGFRQKTRRRRSATQGPAACMQASVNFAVTRAHASCEETNIHTNVCAYIYRLYIYIHTYIYTHTHHKYMPANTTSCLCMCWWTNGKERTSAARSSDPLALSAKSCHGMKSPRLGKPRKSPTIGGLIIRIGFWSPLDYKHNTEPPK